MLIDPDRIQVNRFQRCCPETSADLIELFRGRRGIAQGFADRGSQPGQAAQNVLLVGDADLLMSQHLPADSSVQRRHRYFVLISAQVDLASNYHVDALAHGNLPRGCLFEFVRGIGKFLGQLARIFAAVDVDKAGAFQSHAQHWLQGVIQYRVACLVPEVANQHRDRIMRS